MLYTCNKYARQREGRVADPSRDRFMSQMGFSRAVCAALCVRCEKATKHLQPAMLGHSIKSHFEVLKRSLL